MKTEPAEHELTRQSLVLRQRTDNELNQIQTPTKKARRVSSAKYSIGKEIGVMQSPNLSPLRTRELIQDDPFGFMAAHREMLDKGVVLKRKKPQEQLDSIKELPASDISEEPEKSDSPDLSPEKEEDPQVRLDRIVSRVARKMRKRPQRARR
jgi:hypothetical protein